ncbi:MAG: hypothetical protein ACD_76C00101G0002 [uncultured bacterium]|nr:MAG: hypothetical protein ACD_76C00101G0002 [uncultured bacterium]
MSKRKRIIRRIWAIVSLMVILSMLVLTASYGN